MQSVRGHVDVARCRQQGNGVDVSWCEDPYGFVFFVNDQTLPTVAIHANLWWQDGQWILCNVAVMPQYRGRGLTHRLMAALAAWQRHYNVKAIYFPIASSNMSFWGRMALDYPLQIVGKQVRLG